MSTTGQTRPNPGEWAADYRAPALARPGFDPAGPPSGAPSARVASRWPDRGLATDPIQERVVVHELLRYVSRRSGLTLNLLPVRQPAFEQAGDVTTPGHDDVAGIDLLPHHALLLQQQAKQHVLRADIAVAKRRCRFGGLDDHLTGARCEPVEKASRIAAAHQSQTVAGAIALRAAFVGSRTAPRIPCVPPRTEPRGGFRGRSSFRRPSRQPPVPMPLPLRQGACRGLAFGSPQRSRGTRYADASLQAPA